MAKTGIEGLVAAIKKNYPQFSDQECAVAAQHILEGIEERLAAPGKVEITFLPKGLTADKLLAGSFSVDEKRFSDSDIVAKAIKAATNT